MLRLLLLQSTHNCLCFIPGPMWLAGTNMKNLWVTLLVVQPYPCGDTVPHTPTQPITSRTSTQQTALSLLDNSSENEANMIQSVTRLWTSIFPLLSSDKQKTMWCLPLIDQCGARLLRAPIDIQTNLWQKVVTLWLSVSLLLLCVWQDNLRTPFCVWTVEVFFVFSLINTTTLIPVRLKKDFICWSSVALSSVLHSALQQQRHKESPSHV